MILPTSYEEAEREYETLREEVAAWGMPVDISGYHPSGSASFGTLVPTDTRSSWVMVRMMILRGYLSENEPKEPV